MPPTPSTSFLLLTLTTSLLAATTQPTTQPDPANLALGTKALAEKKLPLALSYFQKSADAGNTTAMYHLAAIYAKGFPGNPPDYTKALPYLQKSAAAQNPDALYLLGIFYFQGWALPQDPHQAFLYWQKAADAGNTSAMHNVALIYSEGKITPTDNAKSFHYLQQGALHNDPDAYILLALSYIKGIGTSIDNTQAVIYLQKAADLNNPLALYYLAHFQDQGIGTPKDPKAALANFIKAADLGHLQAAAEAARLYGTADPPDFAHAILYWKKIAAAGNAPSAYYIALVYASGKPGVPQDANLALQWMHKAADLGDPDAIAFLRNGTPTATPITQPAAQSSSHLKPLLQFTMSVGVGHGDFITLPVTINKKEYLFLLDTGSSGTTLDSSITDLGPPAETIEAHTLNQTLQTNLYHAPPMFILNQPLSLSEVAATDLSAIRQASGQPIMGFLGMDYLSHYILQLDFKNRRITLFDPALPYDGPEPSFNLGNSNRIPVFMTDFLGQPHAVVRIDTGLDGDGAVRKTLPDLLGKNASVTRSQAPRAAFNGQVPSDIFLIKKSWQLAGTSFSNLTLISSENNIIGMSILSDYIVTLDFPHDKLFLNSIRPNHPAPSPTFGFSITSDHGNWFLDQLDTHAKSFGLQEHDQLLEINARPVTNLPRWELLTPDATALTLKIKRQNQTLELKIPAEQ